MTTEKRTMTKIEHTFMLGNQQITLETNRIAKQADASVVVYCGETMVMANICAAKTQKPDIDFFPLTVNYQEKFLVVFLKERQDLLKEKP